MTEPLKGWHHAHARERRTALDFAHEIDWLLNHTDLDFAHEIDWLLNHTESPYRGVPKIKLVTDNLNIHDIASLYKAFPAPHAHELCRRIEWHYTPKHGSWLNVAEIVIGILERQCIGRRIVDIDTLNRELDAWESDNNSKCKSINWQFTTDDARIRLRRLYPVF